MSGRGDNNKAGSAGRGASNQSNQGMQKPVKKSNHGEAKGQASKPQRREQDQDSNRDHSTRPEQP